jgi:hypothetical protein
MLFGREINLPIELVLGRPGYNEYSHELKTVYADEISEKLTFKRQNEEIL